MTYSTRIIAPDQLGHTLNNVPRRNNNNNNNIYSNNNNNHKINNRTKRKSKRIEKRLPGTG